MPGEGERKQCADCGEEKPLEAFRAERLGKLGRQARCKDCAAMRDRERRGPAERERKRKWEAENRDTMRAARRAWWARNGESRAAYERERRDTPEQQARQKLRDAVKCGTISKPEACEQCGALVEQRHLHGHHQDYRKPLEVEWLCSLCHGKKHRVAA